MVVYAEYEIPADAFRIGRAFGQLPDVEVELERIVPTGPDIVCDSPRCIRSPQQAISNGGASQNGTRIGDPHAVSSPLR